MFQPPPPGGQPPSFHQQPTYPNFSVPPRQPSPPPRQKRLIPLWVLIVGGLLILLVCGGVSVAMKGATTTTPTVVATATPTSAAVLLATATDTPIDTPTASATLVPMPTPSPTPTVMPTPRPTPTTPTPTPQHIGVNGNPWGYDFNPGNLIYSPASAFCSYFSCVSTFWTATQGYVAECANQEYTHSGGVSGACSRDGGVSRPLYSH